MYYQAIYKPPLEFVQLSHQYKLVSLVKVSAVTALDAINVILNLWNKKNNTRVNR